MLETKTRLHKQLEIRDETIQNQNISIKQLNHTIDSLQQSS